MKRSEINNIIKEMEVLINENGKPKEGSMMR